MGLGSGPVPTNKIIKTAAYLWAKNRSPTVVHFRPWQTSFIFFYHRSKQLVELFVVRLFVFRLACV